MHVYIRYPLHLIQFMRSILFKIFFAYVNDVHVGRIRLINEVQIVRLEKEGNFKLRGWNLLGRGVLCQASFHNNHMTNFINSFVIYYRGGKGVLYIAKTKFRRIYYT